MFEPRALNELVPGWREDPDCPVKTLASKSKFKLLTRSLAVPLPNPPQMKNKGNFIISLRWGRSRGRGQEGEGCVVGAVLLDGAASAV